ncbi:chaperonin 10-like protein [Paraphoma chrysanthemicola]|uniref:Chaperonin 10-like protein n=1 Tax=Paraphoma chrysanthemicola TaxID=798071 RepID=A0A8K0R057_9PLEO|nr:chaperonin 10-like protein [Paraphoma chrysanthemicola]
MSTPPHSKALYIDHTGHTSILPSISINHEPLAPNEVLIEALYSGVNPADTKHFTLGIHSTIMGYDFCGRVISTPQNSQFVAGDIVAGYTPSGIGRPKKYGTHQAKLACPEEDMFKVPENLPKTHAAALTVVAMTAADAVFNFFERPLPVEAVSYTSPVLVWGASSSVGICTVQFLRTSGCKNVFVTASPKRWDLLKSLGAKECFDYNSPSVRADIAGAVEALGQGPITHALDAVGTFVPPRSSDQMAECVQAENAVVLACVTRFDGGFQMPVATTREGWRIQPPGAPAPISLPALPERHKRAWAGLMWAVENYGGDFELPVVEELDVSAEEILPEVVKVGGQGRGFGKLIIRQPLR